MANPNLDLAPLHLPPEPGFWPLAWGWWAALLFVVVVLTFLLWMFKKRQRINATKKLALEHLNGATSAEQVMQLLKQAAFGYVERQTIAGLSGDNWYQWLDAQIKTPLFAPNAEKWNRMLYQGEAFDAQLKQDAQQWLTQALPLKAETNKRASDV
ncbi:DUF4381 domain-containing protein [Vibrio sp. SCSIO 43136]|uniref:DUF4381 domain-containing protein n=1 Tax=Vibrio sp. SCSIO 43136 TaxID=2819101 RepID=UPI002075DE06|nr:DUF4381 domain-containing protein [Vibrio sp. SCSIO 43136]USD67163.1 DUF4381 domain-containing protein [Vibrio sp. SCSIO 43136]